MKISKKIVIVCLLVMAVIVSLCVCAQAAGYPPEVSGFRCSSLGSHTLQLKWNKVKNADGYIIYRAPLNYGSFEEYDRNQFNGTYIAKKDLDANTGYRFAIKAYYTVGKVRHLSKSYPVVRVTTLPATAKN